MLVRRCIHCRCLTGFLCPTMTLQTTSPFFVCAARVPWEPPGVSGPDSLFAGGGSLLPVTIHMSPLTLLLGGAALPPPIRPSTSLLSSAESSMPVPDSSLTPPATSLHSPSNRNVHTSLDQRRRRTSRNSKERTATVRARSDAADALQDSTQSGGLLPADPRRSPPPPLLA